MRFFKEAVTQHLLSHEILSDYFDTNRRDLGRVMKKCGCPWEKRSAGRPRVINSAEDATPVRDEERAEDRDVVEHLQGQLEHAADNRSVLGHRALHGF